jgi:hypothetical protein
MVIDVWLECLTSLRQPPETNPAYSDIARKIRTYTALTSMILMSICQALPLGPEC